MSKRKFTARYTPIEDGWWLAEIVEEKGCLTQGKSLRQARGRIREALSAWLDREVDASEIVDDLSLPADLAQALQVVKSARAEIEAAERESRKAVRLLARKRSMRDVGELTGLSHSRVQQIVAETEKRAKH